MINAYRDENNVPTKLGVLDTDGSTSMRLYVREAGGAMVVKSITVGTYPGGSVAKRDDNFVTGMLGVSTSDQKTPRKFLIDSSNELLVKVV